MNAHTDNLSSLDNLTIEEIKKQADKEVPFSTDVFSSIKEEDIVIFFR